MNLNGFEMNIFWNKCPERISLVQALSRCESKNNNIAR